MIVFATSIAECGEKEYLERFMKYCKKNGKDVKLFEQSKIMIDIAKKTNPNINKYTILKLPETTLNALRAAAYERILSNLDRKAVNIISAHTSFWVKSGPEPAIDISYLMRLNPDIFIQFVDLEYDIYTAMKKNKELDEKEKLSLKEIALWQEIETYTNRLLAREHNKPFYLIGARYHPESMLYDLIFNPWKPKIYQSFPITHLDEKNKMKVLNFIKKLRKYAIVFDPIEVKHPKINDNEITELIDRYTVKRDMRLIDQSDFVVVYFPKLVYSSGVEYEINYAAKLGKQVWIIKPDVHAGPFTEYNADRIFNDPNECLEEIKKYSELTK